MIIAAIARLTGFLLAAIALGRTSLAWAGPTARDITRDWKRWSRAERIGALSLLALLLSMAARAVASL